MEQTVMHDSPASDRGAGQPVRLSRPNGYELLIASLALIAWLTLFVGGVSITTTPYFHNITDSNVREFDTRTYVSTDQDLKQVKEKYQEQVKDLKPYEDYAIDAYNGKVYIRKKEALGSRLVSLIVVALCYTVSNVGLLCILASILGSVGHSSYHQGSGETEKRRSFRSQYVSAALGGLVVYLIFFSGAYTIFGFQFNPPSPNQVTEVNEARLNYAKLAMLASLFSFIEGYSPFVLTTIVEKTKNLFSQTSGSPSSGASTQPRTEVPSESSQQAPVGTPEAASQLLTTRTAEADRRARSP